jgi:aspartate carbamoyltransferase catalytic subunit
MMKNRSLVAINDLSKEEIIKILDLAEEFEKNPIQNILSKTVVASLFFEPSTRTRLSFESAANRLGGRIIGFSEATNTSVSKGESLKDTILTVANYSDLIVMRHPVEGSARYASEVSPVPIINAGDGANQHPTQTLLDLFSIRKTQGTLNNLNIFLVGDLKYGRTVHSLLIAMSQFGATFTFVAPKELQMPDEYKMMLDNLGLQYTEQTDLNENLDKADIIYMTRVQKERFSDPVEYEKVKNVYVLRNNMLEGTKPSMRVLHPLPRVNEIHPDVDASPKAYYFPQAMNGVYTRMAIMSLILDLK